MKVYFAASLFTGIERKFNEEVTSDLEGMGYSVYLPQRDGGQAEAGVPLHDLFNSDLNALDSSDLVVAILNGAEPDSGTVFEVGYACAKQIPVYIFKDDFRSFSKIESLNLMLSESCKGMFNDIDELLETLFTFINKECD